MPKNLNRPPTNEELNHPSLLINKDDEYLFETGKQKGLSDELMYAMYVVAIADNPVADGANGSLVYSEDELKSMEKDLAAFVYDEKKKRFIGFLPSPEFLKNNKNGTA